MKRFAIVAAILLAVIALLHFAFNVQALYAIGVPVAAIVVLIVGSILYSKMSHRGQAVVLRTEPYERPAVKAGIVIIIAMVTMVVILNLLLDEAELWADLTVLLGLIALGGTWSIMAIFRTKGNYYSVYKVDAPWRKSLPQNALVATNGENALQPEFDTTGWAGHSPLFRERRLVEIPEGIAGEKAYVYIPFGKYPTAPYMSGPDVQWERLFGDEVDWDDVREALSNATRGISRKIFFGGGKLTSLPPYVMVVTRTRVYYYDMRAPEFLAVADANGKPKLTVLGLKEEDFPPITFVPMQRTVGTGDAATPVTVRKALQITLKDGLPWTGASLEESGIWWPKVERKQLPAATIPVQAGPKVNSSNHHIEEPTDEDVEMLRLLLAAPSAPFGDLDACLTGWQPHNWSPNQFQSSLLQLQVTEKDKNRKAIVRRGPQARLVLEGGTVVNSKYVDAQEVALPVLDAMEIGVVQCLIGQPDPKPYDDGTVHVPYRGIWKVVVDRGQLWPFNRACFDMFQLYAGVVELSWKNDVQGTFGLSKDWVPFRVATFEGFEEKKQGIDAVPFVHVRISRPKAGYVVRRYGVGAKSAIEILKNLTERLKPVVEEAFRAWAADKKIREDLLEHATKMRESFFEYLKKILEGERELKPGESPEDYGVTLVQVGVQFVNWPDEYMALLRQGTYARTQVGVYKDQEGAQKGLKTLNEAKARAEMAPIAMRAKLLGNMNKQIAEALKARSAQLKEFIDTTGLPINNKHVIAFVRQLVLDDDMLIKVGQGGVPMSRLVGMLTGNTADQPLVSQTVAGGDNQQVVTLVAMLAGVAKEVTASLKPAAVEVIEE